GAAAVLGLWVVAAFVGRLPPLAPDAPTARIGIVQTNVAQDNKLGWSDEDRENDWRAFVKLTHDAASKFRPDLIVWPETMFPGEALNPDFAQALERIFREHGADPAQQLKYVRELLQLHDEIGIPLLIGAQTIE